MVSVLAQGHQAVSGGAVLSSSPGSISSPLASKQGWQWTRSSLGIHSFYALHFLEMLSASSNRMFS